MPQTRQILPNIPVHITQRGVDRCATFLTDEDFGTYLWILESASAAAGCAVHAYALMTNHVHLLVTPTDGAGPARMMRALGIRYVRYFNARHGRTGTLWEGRYKSKIVATDSYFLACSRYIECNPERAGLTHDLALYEWSSFRGNALGEADRVLSAHPSYIALGSDPLARARAYRCLFATTSPSRVVAAVRTSPLGRRPLAVSRYQEAAAALSSKSTIPIPDGRCEREP